MSVTTGNGLAQAVQVEVAPREVMLYSSFDFSGGHIESLVAAQNIRELIRAGNYTEHMDFAIADRFSSEDASSGEIAALEARLFYYGCILSAKDAEQRIVEDDPENPWTPAKMRSILLFGAKHPEEQTRYPIFALGALGEIGGLTMVASLTGAETTRPGQPPRRYLKPFLKSGGFSGACRFLAVRKKVPVPFSPNP